MNEFLDEIRLLLRNLEKIGDLISAVDNLGETIRELKEAVETTCATASVKTNHRSERR